MTLQNLADAMGVSRERMRQIETVGLRKVEARLGGRRMGTHSECYAGRRRVRTGGVERMIPVDGHGIKRRRTPAKPRDVINARCLEALRETTPDGRYVTATAVAPRRSALGKLDGGFGSRWPWPVEAARDRSIRTGAGGVSWRGRYAMANVPRDHGSAEVLR